MSVIELLKLLLVLEQGCKSFYLVYLYCSKCLKIVPQLVHRKLLAVFRKGSAHGNEKVCIGGEYDMLIIKL